MAKTQTTTKRAAPKKGRSSTTASLGASGGANRNASSTTGRRASKPGANAQSEGSRLKEFFVDELKDIYWAEQKLVKTLPKLQKAATSEELRAAFGSHLKETQTQVQRLEKAFKLLGEKAVAKKCDAMQGITQEGSSVIEDTDKGTSTRDVGLIMAGQKAEHYEIATYGGLIQIARTLGHEDVAQLLNQTLEEEKNADKKLTEIAENNINNQAAGEREE
jgi:ferritin-like metal-binding protein YciE